MECLIPNPTIELKDITKSSFHSLHALYKGEVDHVWLIEINSDWLTIKINWIIYVIGYWFL